MQRDTDRIRTTHTGSMPRPQEVFELMNAEASGQPYDPARFEEAVKRHVADIVRLQVERGVDVVNDGECSKPSFNNYIAERIGGLQARIPPGGIPTPTGPIGIDGRDARAFPDYYQYVLEHNPFAHIIRLAPRVCVGPVSYIGRGKVMRDIANLKAAMAAAGAEEGFLPAASPVPMVNNEYYATEEEYFTAYGEAMREEYMAILDAGLMLQIDDPRMVSSWDARTDMSLPAYRDWMRRRVEFINHALRGFPPERVRYHTCYGVNFGPRVSDLQLEQVIDVLFTIQAGAYSFEAANPRHEHEWHLFERVKVPDGKILIPGAVTHSNVTIEHPELVADRIMRWANTIGRENLMVGNDCGFQSTAGNSEIPPSVAWAKLAALGEGARIASRRLWQS
jgi:5-methyltetrahydropteroyltriglutamate--homocysteine methyltransferase